MKVALKELRESLVWLKIIEHKPLVEPNKMTEVIKECDELNSSPSSQQASKPRIAKNPSNFNNHKSTFINRHSDFDYILTGFMKHQG